MKCPSDCVKLFDPSGLSIPKRVSWKAAIALPSNTNKHLSFVKNVFYYVRLVGYDLTRRFVISWIFAQSLFISDALHSIEGGCEHNEAPLKPVVWLTRVASCVARFGCLSEH